jgi:hypothetical protein
MERRREMEKKRNGEEEKQSREKKMNQMGGGRGDLYGNFSDGLTDEN